LRAASRSGPDRLQFIVDALGLAVRHPLLGLGVGSNKAYSLIPALLSNTGFIGTGVFLAFLGTIAMRTVRGLSARKAWEEKAIGLSLMATSLSVFGTLVVSVGLTALLFPWFWLLLALMVAAYRIEAKTQSGM